MMDVGEKEKILQGITTRVSTGIDFIEFRYLAFSEKPDLAWIRNIYILLSFYTELLLKAIYIAENDFDDINVLDEKLKDMGHKLDFVAQQIGKKTLNKYKIDDVELVGAEYLIKTSDGSFYVKDFTDIRYDFIQGRVRQLDGMENKMFKKQIDIMHSINGLIKPIAWSS